MSTSEFDEILNVESGRRYSYTDCLYTPASHLSHFGLHLIFSLVDPVCVVSRLSTATTET